MNILYCIKIKIMNFVQDEILEYLTVQNFTRYFIID